MDDPEDESPLVLACAGCRRQAMRGILVDTFLKIALDDDLAGSGYLVAGIPLQSRVISCLICRCGRLDRPLAKRARG